MQTLASLSLYSPTPHPRLPPTTTSTPPHQLRRRPSSVLCSSFTAPTAGGGGGGLYSPTPHSHHPRPPPTTTQLRRRRLAVLCSSLPAGGGGDFHAFAEAAKDFNLIPFCRTIFFDEDTSTKVYLRLTKEDEGPYSPSFISTLPSSKGRYTLIGAQPAVEFVAKEKFVTVIDGWEGSRRDDIVEDPMRLLKRMMEKWKPQPLVGLPDTFCGGWFGYFSYDTFRYVEKKLSFSSAPKDDRFLPDIDVCLYDDVIVFDHLERKTYLIHWVLLDRYDSLEAAFFRGKLAESRLDSLFLKLPDGILPGALDSYIFDTSSLRSNMTKEEYSLAVVKAKNNIGVGDHVVLSRRFYRRIDTDPFTVYRQLWSEPFGTYLKGRGYALISKSQENLVFVKQDTRELSERLSCWDALQAALPSAVVCGAPKAKAMELIDQLEQSRRGPYGGGVGFVSFFGDMDMSVSSDMILFPTGTGVAHIQVGIPVIRGSIRYIEAQPAVEVVAKENGVCGGSDGSSQA